jgi:hypothetical protein
MNIRKPLHRIRSWQLLVALWFLNRTHVLKAVGGFGMDFQPDRPEKIEDLGCLRSAWYPLN